MQFVDAGNRVFIERHDDVAVAKPRGLGGTMRFNGRDENPRRRRDLVRSGEPARHRHFLAANADVAPANPAVANQVEQLLNLRGVIGQAIERARQEKLIGNALEAAVVLRCDPTTVGSVPNEELEEFFILSELKIEPDKEPSALITKTTHGKCARCWRYRPAVGKSTVYPELCDRCEAVVSGNR